MIARPDGAATGSARGAGAADPVREQVGFLGRDFLISQVLASDVTMVVAGAGYGKTTLAGQIRAAAGVPAALCGLSSAERNPAVFVASLRRAARAAGLSDVAELIGGGEPGDMIRRLLASLASLDDAPVAVIIDDAHELSPTGLELLASMVAGFPRPHRLVVCARDLGNATAAFTRRRALCITEHDLAFTPDEVTALARQGYGTVLDERRLAELIRSTAGWPAAVAMILADASLSPRVPDSADVMDDLLASVLARLDPVSSHALGQLAHLPVISAEIAEAVSGPETFARLRLAGVPFARRGHEVYELPGPAADRLRCRAPLAADTARRVATVLVGMRRSAEAVWLLIGAGCAEDAAALLAGFDVTTLADLGLAVLEDMVDRLPDTVLAARPALLLHLAQQADTDSQPVRARALHRLRALDADQDPEVARQMAAEHARDLMWDERTRASAVRIAEQVLADAGPDERAARARALDVVGRCASWFLPLRPEPAAAANLEESARLARILGQRTWVAQALVPLAMGVRAAYGRYEEAAAILRDALGELPSRSRTRAIVNSFLADVLARLGRFDEGHAAAAEVRDTGRALREERLLAYASWSDAILFSFARDRAGTVAAVFDVERHRGTWFDQEAGAEFLAYAADLLDRVGESDLARHYLQRARERREPVSAVVKRFEAQVTARSGDPARAAELMSAVLAQPLTEPCERPYFLLLHAWAAHRRGDPEAGRRSVEAFDALLETGDLAGAWQREPAALSGLLPIALAAGSAGARAIQAASGRMAITTLGRFHVQRDAEAVSLPAGRPAAAVRIVVAAGGRIRAEELIELLWPNASPDVGRNRLRNLLSRLRTTVQSDLLLRDGDVVSLEPRCQVDATRFEELADRATVPARPDDSVLAAATAALALYRGSFLPDDIAEEWSMVRRERLRRRFLATVDVCAAIALRRGEIDEAIRLLHRGLDEDPGNEVRGEELASLLDRQGRHAGARRVRLMLAAT
jgi:DNA-binding SARP family transcriptional activator